MKILQIHNFYKYRGGECEVVTREQALLAAGGHVVTQYTAHSGSLDAEGKIAKIRALARIVFNPAVYRDLLSVLAGRRPDVVHVHNVFPLLSPAVYAACDAAGVPVVQTVHNYRFLCPAGTMYRNDAICEKCITQGLSAAVIHRCMHDSALISLQYARAIARSRRPGGFLHQIDGFIALNDFVRRMLVSAGVAESKVHVLSNYAMEVADRVDAGKQGYVLYLGRLTREKGIGLLLEAAADLPDVEFIIAGDGPYAPTAAAPGNVKWVGRVSGEQKRVLVARARALVVPSLWYENNPMVVIEALAQGTAVIASAIGGLPEMLENGRSGYLFAAGDKGALVDAVRRTAGAEVVGELSEAALDYARSVYSAASHLAGLEAIYGAVLGDGRPGGRYRME